MASSQLGQPKNFLKGPVQFAASIELHNNGEAYTEMSPRQAADRMANVVGGRVTEANIHTLMESAGLKFKYHENRGTSKKHKVATLENDVLQLKRDVESWGELISEIADRLSTLENGR